MLLGGEFPGVGTMAVGEAQDEAGNIRDEEDHGDDDAVALEFFINSFVAIDRKMVARSLDFCLVEPTPAAGIAGDAEGKQEQCGENDARDLVDQREPDGFRAGLGNDGC